MTDRQIFSDAITASRMSARRFTIEVLGVDERTGRKWLEKDDPQPMSKTPRIVCMAIIERPELADDLRRAHMRLIESADVV